MVRTSADIPLWFVWGTDHEWKDPILSRHAHVHGDPEPAYTCDVCGEGFFSVDDWSDHHFETHFQRNDEGGDDA